MSSDDLEGGDAAAVEDAQDDQPRMADLFEELQQLEDAVDSEAEREQVREAMRMAVEVQQRGVFGRIVRGFDTGDAAQALLGALLFGIPMFVEGGTTEVGLFIANRPLFLAGTHLFVLGLVIGILYVADIQDVRIQNPIFGFVPRRLLGIRGISFGTALLMMTLWGVVDWTDPLPAIGAVTVAHVPMSIGAALGDILPTD